MKLRATINNSLPFLLFSLLPLSAVADLSYSDRPLSLPTGVPPNVALMLDNSASMMVTDTGGTGTITSVCDGTTVKTLPLSRMDAQKEAACQIVADNNTSVNIALYTIC